MNTKMWFVYSKDVVSGPFETAKLQEQRQQGRWDDSCFIWWKGQREWMPIREWENQLGRILKREDEKVQTPVWYMDLSGSPIGPLTQGEMIENLRGVSNLAKVRLWTVGMNKWANLFDLHDIMDQLGMSRRENERAPLMGTVAVTRNAEDARTLLTRAASISVAGIGLNEAHGLVRGDEVQLLVKSLEFQNPVRLQATVVYVTSNGYAGLRFETVHAETQSLILDYVKKFNHPEQAAGRRSAS